MLDFYQATTIFGHKSLEERGTKTCSYLKTDEKTKTKQKRNYMYTYIYTLF